MTVNRTRWQAGNAGAGGIYANDAYILPSGTYEITVGNGGQAIEKGKGKNGGNSSLGSLIVYGGGAGGAILSTSSSDVNGSSGGSGGGAGQYTLRELNYANGIPGSTVDASQGTDGNSYVGGKKVTTSDITGKLVTYANANIEPQQNTGSGGLGYYYYNNNGRITERANNSGAKGIVVIRVPKNDNITTTGNVQIKTLTPLTPDSTKYVFITNIPSIVLSTSYYGEDLPELGYSAYRRLGYITINSNTKITTFTKDIDNTPW